MPTNGKTTGLAEARVLAEAIDGAGQSIMRALDRLFPHRKRAGATDERG